MGQGMAVTLTLIALSVLQVRAALALGTDIKLDLGQHIFNPSLVVLRNGSFLAGARTSLMRDVNGTTWWHNSGYLCGGDSLQSLSCKTFDPWESGFSECLFGSPSQVPKFDMEGIEDPKLFHWPGKGVYALLGRKTPQEPNHKYCHGHVVFQQYITRLTSEGNAGPWDWPMPCPLRFKEPKKHYGRRGFVREKNWMPFIYKNELYATQELTPHRVLHLGPDGVTIEQFESDSSHVFGKYKMRALHGGPPLVFIEGSASQLGTDYYLGVVHFFRFDERKVRHYHHFFYKMQPFPPFQVCDMSSELQLTMTKFDPRVPIHKRRIWRDGDYVAFVSGLQLVDSKHLLVSYGSGDDTARVLFLSIVDAETLFGPESASRCSGRPTPQQVI